MIKKIYRLKEREVKKVLISSKPFFSYGIVLNIKPNKNLFNRFAIVIGSKSVVTNVSRNFFRRRFYDFIYNSSFFHQENKNAVNYDLVFIVKKQTKLDKKIKETIVLFEKDLSFLENKIKK